MVCKQKNDVNIAALGIPHNRTRSRMMAGMRREKGIISLPAAPVLRRGGTQALRASHLTAQGCHGMSP